MLYRWKSSSVNVISKLRKLDCSSWADMSAARDETLHFGNLLHSTTQMKELRHKVCAWQARGWFDPDNNEDLYCLTPLWNMHKNVPCGPFVIRGTTGLQRKIRATCGFLSCRTGLSNIKAWGPELARWKLQSGPLDKFGKYEGRDKFGAFNYILQLFLLHHGHSFHTN